MKHICILTQSHLCRNPRVVKEARTLKKLGYNVTILTTFISEKLLSEDFDLISSETIQYIGITNIIPSQSHFIYRNYIRLLKRLATDLVDLMGIQHPQALGYNAYHFLKSAIKMKADLYIAHQEMPTWAGCELIKKGFNVIFDMEDWYSKDLLPNAQSHRPIKLLQTLEIMALSKGLVTYTTSDSMALEMAKEYHVNAPKTIYNVFPFSEREKIDGKYKDRKDLSKVSLIWFSQTVGPGRGLELLIQALALVSLPVEIHIRGNVDLTYKTFISDNFPYNIGHQLHFHELVPNEEIISRLNEHDIGLALEPNTPLNKNMTISNKLFHYLLAGLAVLASDTAGQKEIAREIADAVFIFANGKAEDLAFHINQLVQNKFILAKAKNKALAGAKHKYCWEIEEQKLVSIINESIL